MNPLIAQQVTFDNAWVAPKDRVEIGKCNMRIDPTKTKKEATYQVVLNTLSLSACYNAFLIIIDVPKIYMHQLWFTISKIKDSSSYQFKLDNKFRIGALESVPDLFIDHMYKPWRTFASIIIKCLSVKTQEDIMYQIGNRQTKDVKACHIPDSQSVLGRLKFVTKNKDNQVYGMSIPDVMLNKEIQNSKAYQTYLGFLTGAVNPKKARKGTKAAITPKKKSSFTADDNIIPDLDVALELGKSISKNEAKEHEESRKVHETHECLITTKPTSDEEFDECDAEPARRPTGRRRQTGVSFRDTSNVSKKKPPTQSQKLKGMEMLSNVALLEADTRKAIKASKHETESEKETAESGKTNENSDDKEEHVEEEYVHDANNVHDGVEKKDDVNMEMKDTEIAVECKVDEEMADATQANAEKIDKRKATTIVPVTQKEKPEVPPSSSSLSISSDYAWTKVDNSEVITEVVQTNVINEVKNQLPKLLPKAVSDFLTLSIESKVRDMLQEYTINLEQHDSQRDVLEIRKIKLEHAIKQQLPKHSAKRFDQAAKAEFD
ncbi:hypothetical protein Tco_0129433 [Tanacetum coccineum]